MFLFYGDESGYSGEQFGAQQPVLVVAGILLNTHGASKTRREFRELLTELSELAGTELTELKGQALFRGSGTWAGVGHADRAAARRRILEWLEERGHKVVASGLVYARLGEACAACPGLVGMSARAIATVHTALAIQRAKYAANASGRRKNATLLFFDRQDQDESAVAAAIATPPEWAVEFVGDRASSGELTAIVDTAYFVDSVQAPLIQVADFIAYMIMHRAQRRAEQREPHERKRRLAKKASANREASGTGPGRDQASGCHGSRGAAVACAPTVSVETPTSRSRIVGTRRCTSTCTSAVFALACPRKPGSLASVCSAAARACSGSSASRP